MMKGFTSIYPCLIVEFLSHRKFLAVALSPKKEVYIVSEHMIDIPKEENEDEYSDDDLFKISSWGADLSFRELISRYDDDPELQRNYVWDKPEASRFIDSILLGLPIPSIFLAKTKDEKLLIIDGYQRFMTVRDYVHRLQPG